MSLDSLTWQRWIALLVASLGVLIPPDPTAALLVGPGTPLEESVSTGIWVFKMVLLVHALIFWVAPRLESQRTGIGLLTGDRPENTDERKARGLDVRVHVAILSSLLVAGLALRLPELGSGMWFDEIRTLLDYASRSPGAIVATFDSTNQHVLYSLLASGSISLLGESATALRIPAVIFGVAGVWAIWWFGRRVAADHEALLAAAFLALSYHHVWFSQNGRGYTALLFWTLVATALFVDMLRTERFSWRLPLLYGAAMALGLYTHLTAGAVLATHGLVAAGLSLGEREETSRPARRVVLLGLVLAAAFGLLLYAPVLPQAVETLGEPTMPGMAVEWEDPFWLLSEMASGLSRGIPGGILTLGAGAILVGVGLTSYWRQSPMLTLAMVLPGLLVLAGALLRNHNLWPRFFFFSAGFGVLIGIRGVFRAVRSVAGRHWRVVASGIVAAGVLASAATIPRAWGPKQDFPSAHRYLQEARRPGDAVVALDMTARPLRDHLGGDYVSVATVDDLERIEDSHPRTWLVYTFPTRVEAVYPDIWKRLEGHYRRMARFPGTVDGGSIVIARREEST